MKLAAQVFFLAALCVFATAGCGVSGKNSEATLKETVLKFNEGIRWGRLQEVVPRVHPDNVSHFMKMHEKFGGEIQLSDYEIISSSYDAEKKTAEVTVKVTWYRQNEMELFTTFLVQLWEWEPQGSDWLLTTETYQSGEPF
jgi:hypothetical protein